MNPMTSPTLLLAACALFASTSDDLVQLLETPHGGIQPQAAVDDVGKLHLVYFGGEPDGGDLFYVTRTQKADAWSKPVRVNSKRGSVRRNGVIGHAQMALDLLGTVHVTWLDMKGPAYNYARSRHGGQGFESQRELEIEHTSGLEAGASVAADGNGRVAIVWHAGGVRKDDRGGVYALLSDDHGRTFGKERQIDAGRGICACCGLSAAWTPGGSLYVMYRAAIDSVNRDMTLLESTDDGKSFSAKRIHEWDIPACPVSTTRVSIGRDGGALLTWETEGQVFVSETGVDGPGRIIGAPGRAGKRRKNPVAVTNGAGHTLLAWGDGAGWRSGGTLHWQVFDPAWEPTGIEGEAGTMAECSLPAVAVWPDGTFVLIH